MGVLQRFERRLDRLVNGAFAKAFKADVQPVEIASALQRECDDRAAIVSKGRTMVPNRFVVELGERDHERLSVYAQTLGTELADMVVDHAREQHYTFVGPVEVTFEQADDLDTGMFRVRSAAEAAVEARPGVGSSATSGRGPVRARLEVGGSTYPVSRGSTTIGRGTDTDLRIDDPGISRRHAEIRLSGEIAEVIDLGSTNGTVVDDEEVRRARLEDGTRIRLGSTTLVFRRESGG